MSFFFVCSQCINKSYFVFYGLRFAEGIFKTSFLIVPGSDVSSPPNQQLTVTTPAKLPRALLERPNPLQPVPGVPILSRGLEILRVRAQFPCPATRKVQSLVPSARRRHFPSTNFRQARFKTQKKAKTRGFMWTKSKTKVTAKKWSSQMKTILM